MLQTLLFHLCLCCPVLQWVGLRKWSAIKWNCEAADLKFFFAMPELVSVIAEQRVVFFQYFSSTLELWPQLAKWYGYYFCNLSTFKLVDWLPAGWFAVSWMQKVDNWGRLVPLQSTNIRFCRGSILTFHWTAEWIGNFKENHGHASKLPYLMKIMLLASLLFAEACFQQNIDHRLPFQSCDC